jgi:hypothetical protein
LCIWTSARDAYKVNTKFLSLEERSMAELEMILNKSTRDLVNKYLRDFVVEVRNSRGLSPMQAAALLDLSESQLLSIEENPVFVSLPTLQWMMKKYGYLEKFLDAVDVTTTLIIRESALQDQIST